MKTFVVLILWVLLFAVSWPLALGLLVALPFLWILSIPFRIVGVALHAAVALIAAILFLPARLLGARGR